MRVNTPTDMIADAANRGTRQRVIEELQARVSQPQNLSNLRPLR